MRGTAIGAAFGILPGTGPTIASFISYATEKKVARDPRRFGRGAIEGIAAPEAATSASTQTGFIPTMSLGIPGDPVMALMLGALIIHGIQPGPQMMVEHADMFWGLIASFWVGNILLLLLNLPLIGMWVRLLTVPFRYLFPAALFFVCVGVYSTNNNLFDVGMVTLFGVAGYALMRLRFEPAPLLLGFVLGPMVEENFRRALLSRGELSIRGAPHQPGLRGRLRAADLPADGLGGAAAAASGSVVAGLDGKPRTPSRCGRLSDYVP